MTPLPVGTTTGPGSDPPSLLPVDGAGSPPGVGSADRGPTDASTEPIRPGRSDPGIDQGPTTRSGFTGWLTAVAVVAAGIQVLFIHALSRRSTLPAAGWYDTVQARQLVRGHWLIDPVQATSGAHLLVPTAAHPPLPTIALAVADVVNATGPTSHMVFLALLFVASVVLAGVTVRDLVGERAGILASLVMATFPLLWVNPATVGPETVVIAVTTLLLFAAVRFWAAPGAGPAALVGLALGLCTLTRTDLVALVVLVGLPLGLLVKHASWPVRLRGLAVMGILFLLVVGPWVGRNVALFGHTTILADDFGTTVAGANCHATYSGPLLGWWSPTCPAATRSAHSGGAVSPGDQVRTARRYVTAHRGAAVGVVGARLGRLWGVYRPGQTATLESVTGRPAWVSRLGRWYLYVAVPLAIVGAVILRRRRLLLFPFVAVIVLSSLTAVLAFGDPRFAVDGDVALALLAGVALDAGAGAAARRWSTGPGRHSAGREPSTS